MTQAVKIETEKELAVQARPIYKFAGGKTKLLPVLRELAPASFERYHEPFVGGGALFWDFATSGRLERGRVYLSDANPVIARTLLAVKQNVEAVIRCLSSMPVTEEHYYAIRGTTPDDRSAMSVTDLAAWWLYVNKFGYNGLYRVNKAGVFNVPWGRWAVVGERGSQREGEPAMVEASTAKKKAKPKPLPRVCDAPLLRACSEVLHELSVSVSERSFESTLADGVTKVGKNDFVYFDPPYVPASATADFVGYTQEGFGHEDQVRLRDVALELKKRGVHVMLSNADVPQVRELYAPSLGFTVHEVMAPRSVNSKGDGRGMVKEVVIR